MFYRPALFLLILSVLSSHVYHTYAVNFLCLWCCKDPGDEPPNPPAKPTDYRQCKNRPIGPGSEKWAPDGGWACDQSKVDFPTVEVRRSESMHFYARPSRNARQCIQRKCGLEASHVLSKYVPRPHYRPRKATLTPHYSTVPCRRHESLRKCGQKFSVLFFRSSHERCETVS